MAVITADSGKPFDIPNEEGEQLTMRPLTWEELQHAQMMASKLRFVALRNMPDAMLASLAEQAKGVERSEVVEEVGDTHDMGDVLTNGVLAWTYKDKAGNPIALNARKLDEPVAQWAFAKILEISIRDDGEGEGSGQRSGSSTALPERTRERAGVGPRS